MDAMHRPAQPRTSYGGSPPAKGALRIAAHPRFPRAARELATSMLAGGDADPALAAVFKDAGRYVTAMWTVYLYASGGMTLPQLKESCVASGFTSPGRARLLLQFLQHIGYVEPVATPGRSDRRATRYAPTPAFLAAWRAHLRAALAAASLIEPAIKVLVVRLDQPVVFEDFLRIQAGRLLTLARAPVETPAFRQILMHRYAGLQIVSMLVEADDGRSFPPKRPIPISLKHTAARFGVSYMHVRRLLNDAARAGLVRYDATGTVTLCEGTRETIRFFYATQLAELVASAGQALAGLDQDKMVPAL